MATLTLKDAIDKTAKILFEQDFPGTKFEWLKTQPTRASKDIADKYIIKAENLFEELDMDLEITE